MTVQRQFLFWFAGLLVTLLLLWLLSDILLPFVAGLAVAYFLDPVADRLESWGLSRIWATIVITVVFFFFLVLAILLLIPLASSQMVALAQAWPVYMDRARELFAALSNDVLGDLLPAQDQLSADSLEGFSGRLLNFGAGVLQGVASRGVALLNFIGLMFITPVVSFYLINDWDRIVDHIDGLLPREHAERIRTIFKEIDLVLSGFVRGMGSVCLILAVFYGGALQLAGLEFGFIVGVVAGFISFIPFVGMAVGLVLSTVLALFQFFPGQPEMVAVIVAIFIIGQVLEGNVLTPRLVGSKVGLHPVWVIFGLLALGSLFGFVGMLLAVPIAAAIGVLVRHATQGYRRSPIYWGAEGVPDLSDDVSLEDISEESLASPDGVPESSLQTSNDGTDKDA
jgi:predicted PurR-regulated permease PerM